MSKENNYAYIDGANLHKGIKSLGWDLDYKKFRVWLSDKYHIKTAYLFIGLIPKNKELYKHLQEDGYTLVFKEVVYDDGGRAKGNCDADLVFQATSDFYENKFENSIVVTSDGDYACLIKFLNEKKRLVAVLSPSDKDKCSILLKRTNAKISYINDKRTFLSLK
jgi:uncharacterized LabA/DUF88 family protein